MELEYGLSCVAELDRDLGHLLAEVVAVGEEAGQLRQNPLAVVSRVCVREESLPVGRRRLAGRRARGVARLSLDSSPLGQDLSEPLSGLGLVGVELKHVGQGRGRDVGVAGLVAGVGVEHVAPAGLAEVPEGFVDLADPAGEFEVGVEEVLSAAIPLAGLLKLTLLFELLSEGDELTCGQRGGVAVVDHPRENPERDQVGCAGVIEELIHVAPAVEGRQDLSNGGVLLELRPIGRASGREHVLLAWDRATDLFELGVTFDCLVREGRRRERDASLKVLSLEDVEGRLAADELTFESIEGEQLEDLLGDLVGQRLVDVALLDDPHSDQDLAESEAVVRRVLALEGRVELGCGQLVPLEEGLPDQRPGARCLEQLDDPALDVDVFDPPLAAREPEGASLLLLFELNQDLAERALRPRATVDDDGHRSSPGTSSGGSGGASGSSSPSPSPSSSSSVPRGGSPRASRILLIMAR